MCQDFGQTVYDNFSLHLDKIKKYKRFVFLYPEKWTYHPKSSIDNFKKFCADHEINHEVIYDVEKLNIQRGDLFFLVSDRTLTRILDQAEIKQLEKGKDIGIIS